VATVSTVRTVVGFHNRAESLIVVHPGVLSEAPENPASLVAVESPIREELVCEDPLVGDDVGAAGLGNKFPCPIAHQGPILLLHSRAAENRLWPV
jgi:hypothetical protein